jgi:hypothetical protein
MKVGDLVRHADGRFGFVQWVGQSAGKSSDSIVVLPASQWHHSHTAGRSWWWKISHTELISSKRKKLENEKR